MLVGLRQDQRSKPPNDAAYHIDGLTDFSVVSTAMTGKSQIDVICYQVTRSSSRGLNKNGINQP